MGGGGRVGQEEGLVGGWVREVVISTLVRVYGWRGGFLFFARASESVRPIPVPIW